MYSLATPLVAIFTLFSGVRVLAQATTTLAYDNTYDNGNLSLNQVACSTGPNGLETKNYTTLASLSNFPNLGGVQTITGWNSPECGTCYAVTYVNTTINILGVDASAIGFTVSGEAMNTLTGGQAYELGRVTVTFVQVPASECKI